MKKLLVLVLTVGVLTIFTGLSLGQEAPQKDNEQIRPGSAETTQPTIQEVNVGRSHPGAKQIAVIQAAATKKLVAEAIASTIVTRKGMEFPIVSFSDPTTKGWASCELGDIQTFTQNAAIDLESGKRVKKTVTYPSTPPERKIVSPPNADWIVQSYYRVVTSAGPPYVAGDSAFPAGYSFLTAGNYSSVKSSMHSFVGSLNVNAQIKADLNAKLETLMSNISSYTYSLSASHGTVEHTATIWGTGRTNPTEAHSWYHGYINGTLICAPAYLRDQNALTKRLETWVNGVVRKLHPFDKEYKSNYDVYKGGNRPVFKP